MEAPYILTLSCQDKPGIVARVSGFLAEQGHNIIESQQYGDPFSHRFFMRTEFAAQDTDLTALREAFAPVAEAFAMEWQVTCKAEKPRILLAVSHAGHCLNHILQAYHAGKLAVDIPAIISNHDSLRHMAEWYGVPFHHLPVTPETKPEQEARIVEMIGELNVDTLVLARYMQILSPQLCGKLHGRAINIHHSFLPGFKGANPYKQAYERGVKLIGATAHYVTADLDEGPIIEQEVIRVDHNHHPDALKLLGQDIESRVLSTALRCHVERRVLLNGHKTVVFK